MASSSPSSLLFLLVLVPVLLALGLIVVSMAASIFFFWWSRERCRRESCDGPPLILDGDSRASASASANANNNDEDRQEQQAAALSCATGAGEVDAEALIAELLGQKPLGQATADDIKGLSKHEFLLLFALCRPASPQGLQGEWHVDVLAMGWNFPLAYLLLHWRWGRGWYLGKGFDAESKQGYNTFYYHGQVSRSRRFDILYEGPSAYDEQRSLHLVYGRHNGGLFGRVHEEVRCLHPELHLGLGSLNPTLRSSFNSTPFLIVGPRQPVRHWDRERN